MKIIKAQTAYEFCQAAELFKAYQAELNVDLCFQGFNEELANLPEKYAAPYGAIFLAEHCDHFVGCVGVRKHEAGVCEMKRLFLQPQARGLKGGFKLVETVIAEARQLGYQSMKLDTLKRLVPAIKLYQEFGFQEVLPYYANPLDEVVFMELKL
ncbi:GNAT family N-acetyltransferase [Aliikangiella sp. IMCC44653]